MNASGYALGIDLGTQHTVAALRDPAGRLVPVLFGPSPLLPSAVYAGPDGRLQTGLEAEWAAQGDPGGLERHPKRRIDEGTVWLGGRAFAMADLFAALLARVAGEAARVAGGPPSQVVLTHPADWAPPRLAVLTDAARRAGLGAVALVPEPVAAAIQLAAVTGRPLPAGQWLVVCDIGAGSFDATVLQAQPASLVIVATAGLPGAGGLALDAAVV
ncbi:Hsp70 family protein, partial [Dactylosporangium sp. NPDC051485]|uniref:Hsp70 family protein n=1 Tax=Dactylosporangium sp. NPDC051485 TaxID=3154846 RepID=UPI00343C551C